MNNSVYSNKLYIIKDIIRIQIRVMKFIRGWSVKGNLHFSHHKSRGMLCSGKLSNKFLSYRIVKLCRKFDNISVLSICKVFFMLQGLGNFKYRHLKYVGWLRNFMSFFLCNKSKKRITMKTVDMQFILPCREALFLKCYSSQVH